MEGIEKDDDVIAFAIAIYESQGYPKNSFEMLGHKQAQTYCRRAQELMDKGYGRHPLQSGEKLLPLDSSEQGRLQAEEILCTEISGKYWKEFCKRFGHSGQAGVGLDKEWIGELLCKLTHRVNAYKFAEAICAKFTHPQNIHPDATDWNKGAQIATAYANGVKDGQGIVPSPDELARALLNINVECGLLAECCLQDSFDNQLSGVKSILMKQGKAIFDLIQKAKT